MKVEVAIDLPCPVAEAWDVLTRWERQADWMLDADEVIVRSAIREGVGVRLDVRTRLLQVPVFVEPMEVTGWDPPRALTIAHGGAVRGTGTWALEARDAGTLFTWVEEAELAMPTIGPLVSRLYAPVLRALMGRAQRRLRALVIASGPAR